MSFVIAQTVGWGRGWGKFLPAIVSLECASVNYCCLLIFNGPHNISHESISHTVKIFTC